MLTPSRLTLARQRRGLTLVGLARKLGVTARTVSRWESGDTGPDQDLIARLAVVLEFPASFFCAEELPDLPVGAVSFRALSKTPAGLRDSAIGIGRLAVRLSAWVDERFLLPSPDLPALPGHDPETAASVVRERWGLGTAPVHNMVDLLEARGVRVYSLATDVEAVDAFSFYSKGTPFAVVHPGKTGERQRFDLAHELGHLVLHCEHQVTSGREAEQQAQRFASAFLMPKPDVVARPLWHVDATRIIAEKRRWRVSAMALAHRLHELGMLTEWGYRDACVTLSQAGFRRGEPEAAIVPETSQVWGKVFRSLREQGVPARDVASEVDLTVDELSRLVFGLVPLALDGARGGGGRRATLRVLQGGRQQEPVPR